jgi:hypothetical protein
LEFRAHALDATAQLVKVRTTPKNLSASRATAKILIINFGERFEAIDHFVLLNRFEPRVAIQAARKWLDGLFEIKTAQDFDGLFFPVS